MSLFQNQEKRLNVRRKWRSKIVFENEFGEGLLYVYSKDISLGGLFLEESPPLKLGAHLFLSFALPGNKRPLRTIGEVVRFIEHGGKHLEKIKKGVGVRFVDLDSDGLQQLAVFLNEDESGEK